jgi:hypothetical protein
MATILALFIGGVVAGAAGSALIIGNSANNAGTSNTILTTSSSVVAFELLQNGPGTALMGYVTPGSGGTRGVYGRSDSPNGDGVQARNAGAKGTGAALHAYGQANIGIIGESTGSVPLKLIAPGGIAPLSTNSSTKVTNLNADLLDGLSSGQFARKDQTQHYNCSGYDMRSGPVYIDGGPSSAYYTGSGEADISCAVHLPDGATVTGFSARVIDATASYQVACYLWRVDSSGGITYPSTLTSGIAAAPGLTTLADNSVEFAVIDNVGYTYTADCTLNGSAGSDIAVYRVTIIYSGAP